MSQPNISRAFLNSLLPEGPLWNPKPGGDFDLFLDGISEGIETVRIALEQLAFIRDPYKTPILSDLEKEYGIITKDNVSVDDRIAQLATKIYDRSGTGSKDNLENALQRAGFDVLVHSNSPAVDPALFITNDLLLVNGPIFTRRPAYLGLGEPLNAFIGDPNAVIGFFIGLIKDQVKTYNIPTDPDTWPFIFFVGGAATYGGGGELTSIANAQVLTQRRQEFENIILAYKPVFTWAGILVTYI